MWPAYIEDILDEFGLAHPFDHAEDGRNILHLIFHRLKCKPQNKPDGVLEWLRADHVDITAWEEKPFDGTLAGVTPLHQLCSGHDKFGLFNDILLYACKVAGPMNPSIACQR